MDNESLSNSTGVDYMHPDLKFNYVSTADEVETKALKIMFCHVYLLKNAEASYDFSSNDPFPYPRYTDDWFNR